MKKLKKCMVLSLTAIVMITSMIPVSAAKKKLTVKAVYNTSTKIKGKTKKRYQIRVEIGKKTYKKKASKKGNFTITIPKQKAGKKLTVKAYRKKHKKWKLYAKKTIKTITVKKKTAKTTATNKNSKYPSKEDPINLEQVNKDIATKKKIDKGENGLGPGYYYYLINYGNCPGTALIGYADDFIKIDSDGETVTLKATNGATLYYTVVGSGDKSLLQLDEPTMKSNCLKPGQRTSFTCYDYDAGEKGSLYLKVKAYKNGKLIAVSYGWHYMIKMFALR